MERQPAELGVEVVGRLTQFVGAERLADLDDLLDDVAAARDDDDQHAARLSGMNSTRSNTAA